MKILRSRDFWTSVAEAIGGIGLAVAAGLQFGLAAGLAVGSVALIVFGFLASGGTE